MQMNVLEKKSPAYLIKPAMQAPCGSSQGLGRGSVGDIFEIELVKISSEQTLDMTYNLRISTYTYVDHLICIISAPVFETHHDTVRAALWKGYEVKGRAVSFKRRLKTLKQNSNRSSTCQFFVVIDLTTSNIFFRIYVNNLRHIILHTKGHADRS